MRTKWRILPNKLAILLGLIVLVAGAAAAGASYWRVSTEGTEETIVATVNGDPITAEEFNRQLGLQRAAFINYSAQTNGAEFGNDFWQTEYNGESRLDTLKKQVLKEAVKIRIVLRLAESRGIINGSSYHDLLTEMKKENARREKAVQAGQPVYGPVRFDENTFIDFYISKVVLELKEKMSADELAVTEEQLKQHYESIKDELFRLEDNVRFYNISIPYQEEGQAADETRRQQVKDMMEDVKSLLEQGKTADEAVEQLQRNDHAADIHIDEEQFNNETARIYFKSVSELYESLAVATEAGGVSPVIDDHAAGRYVLAWIIEREGTGYRSFEAEKDNIHKHYVDGRFDVYLNRLINEADVRLEEGYYTILIR